MQLIRHHFDVIDSTNTWAKQNADTLQKDVITLVTATEQTAGRGRFKRKWESAAGQNVLASFCFFIEKSRHDLGNIPQVLALSAATALKTFGFNTSLKWPNDILLSKKKVAGILAETTSVDEVLCFIAGIGINVNMPIEQLIQIDRPATSLLVESNSSFEVETVLERLQECFLADLNLFLKSGFSPFLETYRRSIASDSNTIIRFDDNRTVWEGFFHSINDDGSLNLTLKSCEIKSFIAGEIMW